MKHILIGGCSAIALVMSLAASAQAAESTHIVRSAQQQLNVLGYYSGPADGVVGEQTKAAIIEFQRVNGLAKNGALNPETYGLIGNQSQGVRYGANYNGYNGYASNGYNGYYANNGYAAYNGNNGYYTNGYRVAANAALPVNGYSPYYGYAPQYQRTAILPSTEWNTARMSALPVRFAQMAVNEDNRYGSRDYAVTINGQPVLYAKNQPNALKVSRTYSLAGEDAVIFTAYDGVGGCGYKNYLVSVKADGTYTPAQAIGNCTGSYEARIDGNMLFVSFANGYSGYGSDTWRYGNNSLARL